MHTNILMPVTVVVESLQKTSSKFKGPTSVTVEAS